MIHTASILPFVLALTPALQSKGDAPPGLVLIKGGNTKIGVTKKEVLAAADVSRQRFSFMAREFPQYSARVGDFYLGVTEVTNEQYEKYVLATGARPPESWALPAIDAASRQHAEDENKRKLEAKERGEAYTVQKFNQAEWWRANWEDAEWAIPEGEGAMPVSYIDYEEASAYARWAGLRLMTEEEYQRAVRGNGTDPYPWGDAWETGNAAASDLKRSRPFLVGSFPKGVTKEGVFDLVGNLWEWTSTPFNSYDKWEPLSVTKKIGSGDRKETWDALPGWDANHRVMVGGSFQLDDFAARCTTRRGADRFQSAEAVGFRVAASTKPGVDVADTVMRDDVDMPLLPEGVEFAVDLARAIDRWTYEPGTAQSENKGGERVAIENYAIVTGYDHVLFVPATGIDMTALNVLEKHSTEIAPVFFGVLSTTRDMQQPELPAGTYYVLYRGASKLGEHEQIAAAMAIEAGAPAGATDGQVVEKMAAQDQDEGEDVPVITVTLPGGIDPTVANFIFLDTELEPRSAVPLINKVSYSRPSGVKLGYSDDSRDVQVLDAEGNPMFDDKKKPIKETIEFTRVRVSGMAAVKVNNKGFLFDLDLEYPRGIFDSTWRR